MVGGAERNQPASQRTDMEFGWIHGLLSVEWVSVHINICFLGETLSFAFLITPFSPHMASKKLYDKREAKKKGNKAPRVMVSSANGRYKYFVIELEC